MSGGERQGVAIARAIYNQADLIILDEPTTALSLTETAKVFHFVRQARAAGRSILFIGHNIHHVYDISDRFVVLDRGRVAAQITKTELGSAEALIKFMEELAHPAERQARRRALHDRHANTRRRHRRPARPSTPTRFAARPKASMPTNRGCAASCSIIGPHLARCSLPS